MDLIGYLTHVGDEKASKLLGAKRRTVKAWRLGTRFPRKQWRERIYETTGGIVTFGESYEKKPPSGLPQAIGGKP